MLLRTVTIKIRSNVLVRQIHQLLTPKFLKLISGVLHGVYMPPCCNRSNKLYKNDKH